MIAVGSEVEKTVTVRNSLNQHISVTFKVSESIHTHSVRGSNTHAVQPETFANCREIYAGYTMKNCGKTFLWMLAKS